MVSAKRADFAKIAKDCGISVILARLIRNRDIVGSAQTEKFLRGGLRDLWDPCLLPDAVRAADLLAQKVREGKKIRIIGDYDADGICSTYILWKMLRECGAQVSEALPDRIRDGYGINERLVREAYNEGVDTLLTCDNGIAAASVLEKAEELGMTVIVTDHHEVPFKLRDDGSREYILPPAAAVTDPKIINPQTGKTDYPFPDICGAVVAYKLTLLVLDRLLPDRRDELARSLLPFAGLATVCDVMPLQDENRIIVREGLREAQETDNEGLKALISVNGLAGRPLTCYHAGFVLGPCLNATGRLDSAERALRLFMLEDSAEALRCASQLKELNDSRKSMTVKGVQEAENLIERNHLLDNRVLLILLENCHESLAGIIAGRVREKWQRPTFVLTEVGSGLLKGSGRSVEAYDMYAEMNACEDLFVRYGGHKMAGGLTMNKADFPELVRRINENCDLTQEELKETLHIDMELPPRFLNLELTRELDLLEPCGNGNPRPLFVTRSVTLNGARVLGKNRNVVRLAARDETGRSLDLIRFENADDFRELIDQKAGRSAWESLMRNSGKIVIDMVYYPSVNSWNGRESVQYVLQDFRVRQHR